MLYPIGAPIVVAHRGGAGECPENTAEAFLTMGERGFRYLETDARATLDGVAVLCHDATLDRTVGAAGKVRGYTWRELARVRGGGPAVLRVDEALERHPDAVFNIDAKSDDVAAPLARAIREAGAQSRVCVASFSERRLRRMRGELPETASSLGIGAIARIVAASRARTGAARRRLLKGLPDAQVAQVPLSFRGVPVLTERFVASAHEAGIAVHAWTIDDVDAAARLLGMGVDGIITDVPTAMYEGLRERGLPVSRS
ncbi:glycerophosphodiester phosphodiesterase family protein [Actinomyces sp. oral taxon 848 str. F0332]|nr:glycerophosphodiester phosphodiesterase family protein [Actinomyces sp. oral taxon 848 str. F0332]